MAIDFFTGIPGASDLFQTVEKELGWGSYTWGPWQCISAPIVSTTTDANNTPTTLLRKGLAMGLVTSSKKLTTYSPSATTGEQIALGVLMHDVNMLNPQSGSAEDKFAQIIIGGPIKAAQIPNLDNNVRRHFANRFLFDDDLMGVRWPYRHQIVKATSYTVTTGDNGTHFSTRGAAGAVTFTLPAIGTLGLYYLFTAEADQNLVVTAPANKFVLDGNLTATTATFSTASHKIGSALLVVANDDGTKYLGFNIGGTTLTVS